MKKIICVAACLFCLVLLAAPAFADAIQWIPNGTELNWPPPAYSYDIPTVAYDINALGILADSLKWSIRAIASKSLWIMFLCMSVASIPMFFRHFLFTPLYDAVKRRGFNRKAKALDIRLNHDEIVAEKARDMELSNEARQLFRANNRDALIAQKVHDMEFNAEATDIYKRDNADMLSKRRIADMLQNFRDRKAFKRQNEDELIAEKVHDMEMSHKAKNLYDERNYDEEEEIAKQVRRMEVSLKAKERFHARNFDAEVEERIQQRLISHTAEMKYNELYSENYMEKKAQYQRLAKEYYDLTKYKR